MQAILIVEEDESIRRILDLSLRHAGFAVGLASNNEEALKRGFDTIQKNYQISVQRGALKQEEADKRFSLLTGATSMEAAKDADIVIEAVFEEMEIKKQVFGALDKLAKPMGQMVKQLTPGLVNLTKAVVKLFQPLTVVLVTPYRNASRPVAEPPGTVRVTVSRVQPSG